MLLTDISFSKIFKASPLHFENARNVKQMLETLIKTGLIREKDNQ